MAACVVCDTPGFGKTEVCEINDFIGYPVDYWEAKVNAGRHCPELSIWFRDFNYINRIRANCIVSVVKRYRRQAYFY